MVGPDGQPPPGFGPLHGNDRDEACNVPRGGHEDAVAGLRDGQGAAAGPRDQGAPTYARKVTGNKIGRAKLNVLDIFLERRDN